MHKACASLLFLVLPGCVAAIGNSGYSSRAYPPSTRSLLQERVDSATRIVELRQRRLDELRAQNAAAQIPGVAVTAAEIELEEAKLRLIECRVELKAAEPKPKE